MDGDPLGGIVQADTDDQYGLVKQLIRPLEDWLKETNFCGPLQVTAGYWEDRWQVMEYNVRIGVTTGPLMMTMLENPMEVFYAAARGERPEPVFRDNHQFGMILGIVAEEKLKGESVPENIVKAGNVLWGDVQGKAGEPIITDTRPFELTAYGDSVAACRDEVYELANQLVSINGYRFREDVGESLWPPGSD